MDVVHLCFCFVGKFLVHEVLQNVPLEKLIVAQVVKKAPAFYRSRSFITMITRACLWILRQMHQIHTLTSCFFNINFNIMISSLISAEHVVILSYFKYMLVEHIFNL